MSKENKFKKQAEELMDLFSGDVDNDFIQDALEGALCDIHNQAVEECAKKVDTFRFTPLARAKHANAVRTLKTGEKHESNTGSQRSTFGIGRRVREEGGRYGSEVGQPKLGDDRRD